MSSFRSLTRSGLGIDVCGATLEEEAQRDAFGDDANGEFRLVVRIAAGASIRVGANLVTLNVGQLTLANADKR